jgi:multiple sugar transport system permease protein
MVLTGKQSKASIKRSQQRWGYFFIAPCIFGLLVFNFGPMLFSFIISFTEWNMVTPAKYIGLENFKTLVQDSLVWKSVRVTLYYAGLSVPLITVITFLLALLLNTKVKGMPVFRTIFYIPYIVPIVATSAVWLYIFNPIFGLMNSIFRSVGLPPQRFIFSPGGAVPGLALMAVWGAGNTVVIYLAGLKGISRELYEAADLDGAGAFQRFFHITVPMMTPIIFFNILMAIINAMQTFTQAYVMTGGGPNNASMFLSLYLYREAFNFQKMGYAAAVSWVLFLMVAVIAMIVLKTSGRWVFYESGTD